MYYFIDIKYLFIISYRFSKFKQINQDLWNCRCFVCGDSKKSTRKARGYFKKHKERILYHCFNCDVTLNIKDILKKYEPNLYKEYRYEIFKESNVKKKEVDENVLIENSKTNINFDERRVEVLLDSLLDRLDTLDKDNIAYQYCLDRKIPIDKFNKLYYIDDITKVNNIKENASINLSPAPRLGLPLYNEKGELASLSFRALQGEKFRYLTVKIKDNASCFFGINEIDKSKPVYVVEGPIDSLFLDNCIAVSGTGFDKVNQLNLPNKILIFDNQPHNKEVCKLINKHISKGEKMVIWPSNIIQKDINEMVLAGIDVKKIIKERTFSGLRLKLEFDKWKKI